MEAAAASPVAQDSGVTTDGSPLVCHVWIKLGNGIYRFHLDSIGQSMLERRFTYTDPEGNRHSRGLLRLYSDTLKGRYLVDDQPVGFPPEGVASVDELRAIVTFGLIGGGQALIRGKRVRIEGTYGINPRLETDRNIDRLFSAPIAEIWTVAAAILDAAINGVPISELDEKDDGEEA